MTSRGRQHSQAGFTLVEVVLAVAVLLLRRPLWLGAEQT